jgi:pyridoxal phosphate enzyme (YggS family)
MIEQNLKRVKASIPDDVTLVAVSKTHPIQAIKEAYQCGQRDFGENKVQELLEKVNQLPTDIRWHLIGHLQTNKVKFIVPFVYLIHGVDSFKLLKEINKQASKVGRVVSCLLQFHIAKEETKFGFSLEEVEEMLSSTEFRTLANVHICGVMGMATFTSNEQTIRQEFKALKMHFEQLKHAYFEQEARFSTLSFGMSNDYQVAVDEGSNMIRVGSSIFGNR